jgi:RNA polymerase sigma-70 factor (ECF subfamily)
MDAAIASDFNEMYIAHYRPLSDTAHRIIGIRAIADEIAQEVLLKAWESFTAYDPARGSVAAYLRLMARHRAIDWVRSNSARSRRELHVLRSGSDRAAVHEPVATAVEQRVVWEALAKLPTEQRQPIVLAFYGGMSYREVATYLQLPEGTVKGRIRKGMQTLAAHLQGEQSA